MSETNVSEKSAEGIIVVSGPSGVGKTTVINRILAECAVPLRRSVSATTRSPRSGEIDGVDYHFLTVEDFLDRRRRGEFIESCEVFSKGCLYGTLQNELEVARREGKWSVLVIDVQGALTVLKHYPAAISIFLRPSSTEELERRLRQRGTETEEAIARRLDQAHKELAVADRYGYQVVNDDLDDAVKEICQIIVRHWEKNRHA